MPFFFSNRLDDLVTRALNKVHLRMLAVAQKTIEINVKK